MRHHRKSSTRGVKPSCFDDGTPGPEYSPMFWSTTSVCRYADIVDGVRICYVMTIARDEQNISTSLVTAQFLPLGANCSLRVTDQLAILDGRDTDCARAGGWEITWTLFDRFLPDDKRGLSEI